MAMLVAMHTNISGNILDCVNKKCYCHLHSYKWQQFECKPSFHGNVDIHWMANVSKHWKISCVLKCNNVAAYIHMHGNNTHIMNTPGPWGALRVCIANYIYQRWRLIIAM